jgi:hypothetical protein
VVFPSAWLVEISANAGWFVRWFFSFVRAATAAALA